MMMLKTITRSLLWSGVAIVNTLTGAAQAGSTTVSWTVGAPTCLIDAPALLDLGPVDPTPSVNGAWIPSGLQNFNLVITGCTTGLQGSLRPSVVVTGTPATDPLLVADKVTKWLFKDSGNSVGFYIVLKKLNQSAGSGNKSYELENNEQLYIPKTSANTSWYGAGDLVPAAGATIPLTASVQCGRKNPAGCQNPALRAGSLEASFSFIFAYR